MSKKYNMIDHTADFGIQVFGSDLKDLFENAAFALFDMIRDSEGLIGQEELNINISEDDLPDLMVSWLRELLFLWNGHQKLVKTVNIISISEYKLCAAVHLDDFVPHNHMIKHEIKAVTYHQIRVEKTPSGWESFIIFDV